MYKFLLEQKVYFVLRLSVAMCFIGHGAFGIITKPVWANYFAVFGIRHHLAFQAMPLVGSIDILLGLCILAYPVRAIAGWLVVWGVVTASLRPLSGEPFPEMIERAGNFGAPLALLVLVGVNKSFKAWFRRISPDVEANPQTWANLIRVLQLAVFLLLAGHGWLNLIYKKALIDQYHNLGFSNAFQVATIAGVLEIFAAFAVLVHPVKGLLVLLLIWKASTELFYPHYEVFEWVERGGSYGCILALLMSLEFKSSSYISSSSLFQLNYK